jgi:uncharacterized protein YicC (UPF0701 family)
MTLQSMTGFARVVTEQGGNAVAWELKSVNGKSVEVRLRLPSGFERLEPAIRQAVQKRFSRGNFQATLTVGRAAGSQPQPVVNEAFLKDVAGLAQRLQKQFGLAAASADGLLNLRGVFEVPEQAETDADRADLDAAVRAAFEEAMGALEDARRMLMDASSNLDEARLHMEAAFLATKADIREEIDRLKTHVASGRALLAGGGPIGRKLDFLAQEFNRESNTLCSKSNASSITAVGLELKAVVDQFREQVQNLE